MRLLCTNMNMCTNNSVSSWANNILCLVQNYKLPYITKPSNSGKKLYCKGVGGLHPASQLLEEKRPWRGMSKDLVDPTALLTTG